MERCWEKVAGVTYFYDLAGIHDGDLIRQLAGGGNVMGDQDKARTQLMLDALENVHDVGLGKQVQGRGRLVEDDQVRARDERHCQGYALAHTSGKLVWIMLFKA
jgi:hypothetical protein